MIPRLVTAAVLGASLAASAHAGAATPKRSCNLITDPAGDANDPLQTGRHVHPALSNANLDIVGGDFAATATTVTGVIKLAKAPGLDPLSPQGHSYYVEFQPSVSPTRLYLRAGVGPTGVTYSAGTITESAGGGLDYSPNPKVAVKGRVSGSTIVVTVTTKALKPLVALAPKARINRIKASSFGSVHVPDVYGVLIPGDVTDHSRQPFIAGSPSCVVPVK